jgi:hypothetical protein
MRRYVHKLRRSTMYDPTDHGYGAAGNQTLYSARRQAGIAFATIYLISSVYFG